MGRGVLFRLLDLAFVVALLLAALLPFLGPAPVISVGVWAVVIGAWIASRERVRLAYLCDPHRSDATPFPFYPFAFAAQYYADRWQPMLGSALVAWAGLAVLTCVLRDSGFPEARIRR